MYREITYKAGATKEIIRYYPKGTRKGITRGPIRKKTREEIPENGAEGTGTDHECELPSG